MANTTTVYLFSDETGAHTGGKYFIVAGVAFDSYRKWNRHDLLQAEAVSMKDRKDWSDTKNAYQRIKYIEVVLGMGGLRGRVFFACYRNTKDYWNLTVATLDAALHHFCGGDCRRLISHQGFNSQTRYKLRKALTARGWRVEVDPAGQKLHPEMRLADALCGYLGICHNEDSKVADKFPEMPDWFVNLNENAPAQADA
jgi:hypothetical protein